MRKFLARFRQAPMFSTVYILGAALSVASIMLVAIFLHVKTSNLYPEYGRDKLLYYSPLIFKMETDDDTNVVAGSFSASLVREITDSLAGKAHVAAYDKLSTDVSAYVDKKKFKNVTLKTATPEIFNIFDYEFIEGKPFADGIEQSVAISDRLARRFFGTDRNVVGRKLNVSKLYIGSFGSFAEESDDWSVCGVFKEGSRLLPQSFAEIIAPINIAEPGNISQWHYNPHIGNFRMIIRPIGDISPEEIKQTVSALLSRATWRPFSYSAGYTRYFDGTEWTWIDAKEVHIEGGTYELSTLGYPRNSLQMALGDPSNPEEEYDLVGLTKLYGLLALVLLLVPALNLSSLISGNMDSKMSEMGIRKAFGARNSTLLRHVINENLWLTGCGAILGVIMAWIGVVVWRDWLFAGTVVPGSSPTLAAGDVLLDPAMLLAPKVFVAAVLICVTLNLLSSLIPAWWALRRPAIDAIKAKS